MITVMIIIAHVNNHDISERRATSMHLIAFLSPTEQKYVKIDERSRIVFGLEASPIYSMRMMQLFSRPVDVLIFMSK